MRNKVGLLAIIILLSASFALGLQSRTVVEKLENLRLDLIEVQGKQEMLQQRALQLDEEIKPENIARSLAGVGSTKPEELREYRRKQLEHEKKTVQQQLDTIVAHRVRLEAEIAMAEIQAYHESAKPDTINQSFMASLPGTRTLLIGLAGGVFAVMGVAFLLIRRRMKIN